MNKLEKISSILVICACVFISGNVNALNNIDIDLSNEKESYMPKEEFVVSVKIKNLDKVKNGINAYEAIIDYDKNRFEEINSYNFTYQNNWNSLKYNQKNNKFVIINKVGVKEDEEIIHIKLKVKENAPAGFTEIKIKNNVVSEGKEDIHIDNETTKLEIIRKDVVSNENSSTDLIDEIKKESSPEKNNFVIYIWAINGVLLIAAIYSYKRKKFLMVFINKKLFTSLIGLLAVGEVVTSAYVFVVPYYTKGKINDDNKIDYVDVNAIQEHIIEEKIINEDNLKNADMNSDGKITITDLSLLIRKVENILEYDVTLADSQSQNFYPKKGEEINLYFLAAVSDDEEIKKVIISEEEYEVIKVKQEGTMAEYKVVLPKEKKSGVKEFKFTKVILANNEKVKVDYKISVDVLKEMPSIKNYKMGEDAKNSQLKASFSIKDNDNSITSLRYEIVDNNQNMVKEGNLKNGQNELVIDAKKDITYYLNIYVNYNLDTDKLSTEKDNSGFFQESKELQLINNYNLVINDIKTYRDNKEEKVFEKSEKIKLQFNSHNSTKYYPEIVKINDKYYQVNKNDNIYEALIDGFSDFGKKEIKLEEVILNNGKVFELNNSVNVEIIKRKPTVISFDTSETDDKLNIKFKLEDIDNALKTTKIVLLDESLNKIAEKKVNDKNINLSFDTVISDFYIVQVISDYNLSESIEQKDKILYEEKISSMSKAEIKNATISKLYPSKQELVDITYELITNKKQEISSIIVNSIIYPVSKIKDETYKITVNTDNVSGIKNLEASKVIFADGNQAKVSNTLKVDVLKDKPTIENYEMEDIISNSKVKIDFDLIDSDNSFITGKIELTKLEDNTKVEKNIKVGNNSFEFAVEEKKEYALKILVDYDLDTNTLANQATEINLIKNDNIFTQKVVQIADYQLNISNIKTYKNSQQTNYFEKQQPINLKFDSVNATEFYPIKAVILGKEYQLTKNNSTYSTEISGFDGFGSKEIIIEKIVLNNYKELEITNNNKINVEILKEEPTVENFLYKETNDAKLEISFDVIDQEDTISQASAIVESKNGTEVLRENLIKGQNKLIFDIDADEIYTVKVMADYDLDTNVLSSNQNEYSNQELLLETIDLTTRLIQMKDIQSISLFKQNNSDVELIGNININDLTDLDNYIVKVNMKDNPSFYSSIREYKITDNKLNFVLNYDNVVQYEGNEKRNDLIVNYGYVKNNVAVNTNIENLIKEIEANPTGTFELTQDISADVVTTGNTIIDSNVIFKGKLIGNGYKIYNLNKPLFNSTSGATIENLVIENSNISNGGRGLIANEVINGTIITNVHANNVNIAARSSETGTLIGTMKSNSIMQKCSVNKVTITSGVKRIGGIVGAMANSSLNNSYVKGNISSSQDGVGGITGFAQNVTISETYAEVVFNTTSGPGYNGGFVGHSSGTQILNSLSLATGGKASKFIGTGGFNNGSINNYELSTSTLNSNSGSGGVTAVDLNVIKTPEFYKNQLQFSDSIWDYSKVASGEMPLLKNDDPIYTNASKDKPTNENVYIPDYSRLKSIKNYNQSKEIIYHNLYKLMPFYDAKYIVMDGNKINPSHELNTKLIKEILPIDSNNNLVLYLTNQSYNKIKKIKIIYEDNSTKNYNLTYNNNYGNVASYTIDELSIFYNFNRYIIKENSSIISRMKQYIENLDYSIDLDPLTTEDDSRLYKDYYNQTTRNEINEIIFKFLENSNNYTVTLDNKVLNQKIKNDLINEERLKKIVYAYNYYKRWYDIKIGEIDVYDIILFNNQLFNSSMNVDKMTDEVFTGNRTTGSTQVFYANSISKYTKLNNIGVFLDYLITTIGGYQNVNDWFTQNYQGIVSEIKIDKREDIEYRAWTQLKKRNNFLLPFLTLPANSAYIVSSPTQFLIGAQKTYISDPTDETQKQQLITKVNDYGKLIKTFYTTTAGFIEKEYLNPHADIQVDHRFVKNASGQSEYQNPSTTEDDFHKNFNEAVGYWAAANGSAAYATGANVYWNAYPALSSFSTWSHESAHNQDSKVFLKGKGRRNKGWAEDYADGNTTQDFGDGAFNFNLSRSYGFDSSITTNLTAERINTVEKINSYYREMFKASDFLDYIEAKAFLTLEPAEQAKVAVQIYYPNKETLTEEEKKAGDEVTGWRLLTEEQFAAMQLNDVEDLWDNQITIKPGINSDRTMGTNQYGADGIYTRHWYQQHNDNGRPDSYAFKQLAWEMLGYAGYDNGYITYYSGKSQNDLDAIRKITNDQTMTWKKYKMDRYNEMEKQWNKMSYIDADEVLEQYKTALKTDALKNDRNVTSSTNVKRMNYHYLKRITNDFEVDIFTNTTNEIIHIKNSQELKTKLSENPNGNFILDNNIDVSDLTGTTSLISTTFIGKLDGNGKKIIGNTLPIFEKIKYARISNLIIEDSDIQINDTQVGALSRIMEASIMKNVHAVNVEVEGTARTGAIVGYTTYSLIEECTSNATIISTGNAIGGFIGQVDNSVVNNSYAIANVKGKQDVGGFTGWAENTMITNSYSYGTIESSANVAGGFVGQTRGMTKINNSISFMNVKKGYKFDGRSANAMFNRYENNYEYEESSGTPTLNRNDINFDGKISTVNDNKIITESFYTNDMKWDSKIWNYTNITSGGLPKLKNLDPNSVTEIIEKIEIDTIDEFLKINDAPDRYYVLTKNIDFSSHTENNAIIKVAFTGKIDGKGYTLSNLRNAALFADFRGTAQNLKVINFTNEKSNTDYVTAFAKQTYGATIKNIEFNNITLSGRHNVAVLSGMDGRENANSIFEKISIKNANVKGTGVYVATLVGRKYGGKINNCYIEGTLEAYTTENGAISGATHQNILIENVIANVNVNRPRSTDDRNLNGGFVGNIYDSPTIKNSIALGNMTGFTDANSNNINVNKFTAASESIIIAQLENCYEVTQKTGTSSVNENTKTHLDTIDESKIKTVELYRDTLKFDNSIWDFNTVNTLGYPTLKH